MNIFIICYIFYRIISEDTKIFVAHFKYKSFIFFLKGSLKFSFVTLSLCLKDMVDLKDNEKYKIT